METPTNLNIFSFFTDRNPNKMYCVSCAVAMGENRLVRDIPAEYGFHFPFTSVEESVHFGNSLNVNNLQRPDGSERNRRTELVSQKSKPFG